MKLDDIVKDPDIYPRPQISHQTIENYAEALKGGAKFPPILIQKINEDSQEKTIILDGFHRLEACKKAGIDQIESTLWRNEVLDKEQWLEKLRIVSAQCNLVHGDRLKEGDLRFQALRIVAARPIDKLVGIIKELACEFNKTEGYVSQLIGAEVNRRKASRDSLAYRLHLLGWTQEEIGEVVGVDRSTVSDIVEKFSIKLFHSEHESGLSPEKIATNYNLDESLVWAILLEGKDDIKRFTLFGKSEYGDDQPKLTDYWKFNQRDPRLGSANYPGNLYGQLVLNILYRYTQQGDLVIDPMAGGGVTIDACLVMNRKCRAYDIEPSESGRVEISKWDARHSLPSKKECQLIILDPPYYKKKETEYKSSEFSKDREIFLENIAATAQVSYEALQTGGYLAMLYGQYIDYDNQLKSILTSDLCRLIEDIGFRCILKIQSPLTFDTQYQPFDVTHAKSFNPWRILPISKDWQIFKK